LIRRRAAPDTVNDMEAKEPNPREVEVVLVGMVLWLIALVVLVVFFRHDLQRHHATWWYWSCGFGVVLGGYGLRTALRRRGTS
jgi:threonine/homoserine/homoserine lactone efflux protein